MDKNEELAVVQAVGSQNELCTFFSLWPLIFSEYHAPSPASVSPVGAESEWWEIAQLFVFSYAHLYVCVYVHVKVK